MKQASPWVYVCSVEDVQPQSGVAALIDGRQLAVFRAGDAAYAIDNFDPHSGVNVLARGIVGDLQGEPVVASPIYKQHFSLVTGRCIEDPSYSVQAYPAKATDGGIWVKPSALRTQRKRRLVVIGNGMAGMKVVEELLEVAPAAYEITVLGAEPHPNYNRILLSPLLAGEKAVDEIILHPFDWYRDKGVTLHTSTKATQIDRVRRIVRTSQGATFPYDRLLLATGSTPVRLPIPGADLDGVVTFRDLFDVDRMLAATRERGSAVVIGGGLLGLEAANALVQQGMRVTVVHVLPSLMERQLDPAAASLLQRSLEARGLEFRMSARTTELIASTTASPARVGSVRLDDGTELAADLIVMTVGIRPNILLAQQAGLRCDRGVLVDDTMQTFDPIVYAVGECVQHRNLTYGLVAPLFEQAKVCATHLAEFGVGRFKVQPAATQLKVTGIDLFSAGDFIGGAGSEALVMHDRSRGIYKRLVLESNRVRGAVLYGDVRDSSWYLDLIADGRDVSHLRDTLLFGASAQ